MIWFLLSFIFILATVEFISSRDKPVLYTDIKPETGIVEPGQVFYIHIRIENRGPHKLSFLKYQTQFSNDFEIQNQDSKFVEGSFSLRKNEAKIISIPVSVHKRGRYILKPLKIYHGDFLGLNDEMYTFDQYVEIICSPSKHEKEDFNEVIGGTLGNHSVQRFLYEDPILISGYHDYTGKEAMRSISWNQTAKLGKLMVRQYDHTSEQDALVLILSDHESNESFEEMCKLSRSLCEYLDRNAISYSFITNTTMAGGFEDALLNGTGQYHSLKTMELLGRMLHETDTSKNIYDLLKMHQNEMIFLISQEDTLSVPHFFLGGSL